MSLVNRLALASCVAFDGEPPCPDPCEICRRESSAVALELANWLDERFGHSETANLIRGVMPEVV